MTSTLGSKLWFISLALFLAYGSVVLTGILPISLLNATWGLRFCSVLVENAALPLVGVAIVSVAAHLDKGSPSLRSFHGFISRWAMVVALGFLMLVPLQSVSAWRVYAANIQGPNGQGQSQVNRQFEDMRRAVNGASSADELQTRLRAAGGPSLSAASLATPLPVLKARLLMSMEQAKRQATDQFSRAKPSILWSLLQSCFHVILSALGFGLAFAAAAQRPDSRLTVLQEWHRKRKRKAPYETSHGAGLQAMGLFARVEAWQARRSYVSRHPSPLRPARRQPSDRNDKAYIQEILDQDGPSGGV
jgi:hypothetical protein